MMPKTVAYGKGKNTDPNCLNEENLRLRFFRQWKGAYNELIKKVEKNNGKEFADIYRIDFNRFLPTYRK